MCGIAGVFGQELDPRPLLSIGAVMAARLRHRGPDAQRVDQLPDGRGVFAHTRLKIIDLSDRAAQPFWSADRQVALIFNGEIYNFRELKQRLSSEGVAFRSSSDTEVILEQYRRFGLPGLDALDGMFAFALFDAAKNRLVLMRDRLGKKPLYFARAKDRAWVFGSEIKALSAYPALELRPATEHLPQYLVYGYVPTPNTLLSGVHKVLPGTRLIFEEGGEPTSQRYWSLPEEPKTLALPVPEAIRLVRQAIGDAVERRLISDVPLGAFLSGGIDSSIVVAEMARRSPGRVRTFAVGFKDDKSYDETGYAREVAARFDTDHTELFVETAPRDLLEKLLEHHDEPYGDSSALAVYAVARATRPHATVVLTGDGGDELFAGYTRFRGGLIAGHLPTLPLRVVRRLLSGLPEPRGYKNPIALLRRFSEHAERSPDEQLLAWNSFFAGAQLSSLLRKDVVGQRFDPWAPLAEQAQILFAARSRGRDRLDQILRHNLKTYLLDDLLPKADRMTMAASLEARSPFLDTALVELCFRISSELKIRFGQLKWLLREAYRSELPPSVLDRKKHGFGVPVGRWWSGELAPLLDDLLLAPTARTFDFLERQKIRAMIDEHRSGRKDHGQRIFALVNLELWLRKQAFGVSSGALPP